MPKGPENQTHFNNPNKVRQDIKLDMRPQEEISRTEKVARVSKKLSKLQMVGWAVVGGVGLAAGLPVAAAAGGIGVVGNGAEIGVANGFEKRAKKKRLESQQVPGDQTPAEVVGLDDYRQGRNPLRTRRSNNGNTEVVSSNRAQEHVLEPGRPVELKAVA